MPTAPVLSPARRWLHVLVHLTAIMFCLEGCSNQDKNPAGPGTTPAAPGSLSFDVFPIRQDGPAWSRGGLIAYRDNGIVCVNAAGAYLTDPSLAGLWILDPSTSARRRVTTSGEDPAWFPDAQRIAFESGGQIFTIQADGNDRLQLTSGGRNFFPRWTSKGDQITFDSDGGSEQSPYSIWIMRSDGTDKRLLCGALSARMADVGRDGDVTFIADGTAGTSALEVWAADTLCNRTQLTSGGGQSFTPRFGPSGEFIAFAAQSWEGGLPQIWVIGRGGSGQRQVTRDGGMYPSWSPNGDSLVYVKVDSNSNRTDRNVLWVIDANTGGEHQLLGPWPQRCR